MLANVETQFQGSREREKEKKRKKILFFKRKRGTDEAK